jgi:hypothetical protein
MLLKNIIAFSLLAFQAGFGLAKPISVYVLWLYLFSNQMWAHTDIS